MNEVISIRQATDLDSKAISNLMLEVAREFSFSFMTEKGKEKITQAFSENSIVKYIGDGTIFWVAETGENVVGVISIENDKHLKHLFVNGRLQGKGISKQLWEVAKSYLNQNCKSEKITVCSSPTAVKLYEKWGFHKTGGLQDENEIPFVPMEILSREI